MGREFYFMNKFISKIAVALVGCAMAVGVGVAIGNNSDFREARADTNYTINLAAGVSTYYSSANGGSITYSFDHASFVAVTGTSSTDVGNYMGGTTQNGGTANHTRFYQNNVLTFSPGSGYQIDTVVITATSNDYGKKFADSTTSNCSASNSSGTVTVTPTTKTVACSLTRGAASRATQIVINYSTASVTPATSITLTSESSLTLQELATSQIVAAVDNAATDKRLTYESNNESVATVSSTGLITAVAQGSTTITVASYSTPAVNTTVSVEVIGRVFTANAFNKVKRQSELVSGDKYLIVYESSSTAGNAFNGFDEANGNIAVAISEETIVPTAQIDGVVVTIETYSTGYSIKVDSRDLFIGGKSGSNTIVTGDDEILNSITISSGIATITSDTSFIQFNSSNSDMRFRYYKSGTTTQNDVSLYRYIGGTLTTEKFGNYLKNSTTAICNTDGTSANHESSLKNVWGYINAKFNELSSGDKTSMATATALEGGTAIQDALARYDHIIRRYGTANLSDFLGRFSEGGINYSARISNGVNGVPEESSSMVLIIAIASVVSLTAVGGYFFIRRRKER